MVLTTAGLLLIVGALAVTWLYMQRQLAALPPPVPHLAPATASPSPTPSTWPPTPLPTWTVSPPTPIASPTPAPEVPGDEELLAQIQQMPLADKIGQMMIAGFQGQDLAGSSDLLTLISRYHVGGLVLVEANAHDPAQVAQLTYEAQQLALATGSRLPLFIAINHEGGYVIRITEGVTEFPGNMAIAATGHPESAYTAAALAASELRAMGINMNLAPVLDVNDNPLNPIIGARSFSESTAEVIRFGREAIRGLQENGVIAVAKHFPGHGSAAADSHVEVPVIAKTDAQLEQVELAPFQMAVDEDVAAVLTAHVVIPVWEPTPRLPASLSPTILTGILRQRLGFDGLIISDSLNMSAIVRERGQAQAAVEAVQAGTDVVLTTGPLQAQEAICQALVVAVEREEIPLAQIDQSVLRILRAKYKYGLMQQVQRPALSLVGSPSHQAAADRIALDAITLVRDESQAVPLPGNVQRLLVLSPHELPPAQKDEGTLLAEELRKRWYKVTELVYNPAQLASRNATGKQALAAVGEHDLVIFGEWELLSRAVSYADRWQESLIRDLVGSGTPVIMIAWRDPSAIVRVPEVGTYLIAYGTTPAEVKATTQVLVGEAIPQGRLPLTLPLP